MPEQGPKQKPPTMGQYYLMEKVAQGGMAEIYRGLAYDVHGINQKTVCIKKILPHLSADKEFIASLVDEAKLAVRLVHGNIAQTFDLGKVGSKAVQRQRPAHGDPRGHSQASMRRRSSISEFP